jgi:hypothetical protein
MNRRLLLASLLLALTLDGVSARAEDVSRNPFLGTWEYEPARSSFVGRAPYRSARLSFTAVSEGTRVIADIVVASGEPFHFHYSGPEDGTFVTVSGNPYYDSASTVRSDPRTVVRTERRDGKVVGTTTMQVSEDGKSLMASSRRTVPDGGLYTSVITWRRIGS